MSSQCAPHQLKSFGLLSAGSLEALDLANISHEKLAICVRTNKSRSAANLRTGRTGRIPVVNALVFLQWYIFHENSTFVPSDSDKASLYRILSMFYCSVVGIRGHNPFMHVSGHMFL